jgi:hypothetical protein
MKQPQKTFLKSFEEARIVKGIERFWEEAIPSHNLQVIALSLPVFPHNLQVIALSVRSCNPALNFCMGSYRSTLSL